MAAMAVMPAEKASLQSVLDFPLHSVEERLRLEQGCSADEAALLVLELKRWLYACARSPEPLTIVPELIPIDRAWHVFLLFTREYERFCREMLGCFVHHDPLLAAERERFAALRAANPEAAMQERQERLRPQLEFIGGLFGPQVLKRWYQELPARFHFEEHIP
jgi:hypothetical protein